MMLSILVVVHSCLAVCERSTRVTGLAKSGEKLNGGVIKVSPSKTPIVPINREFMPRDEKELERCERTVYVNQIDRAVPGSAVEAMFENFCGATPLEREALFVCL